ncbi:MAG: cupin domain-containing protein [Candidatus Tectomicrobia bacterium]|uniref:Cupin domain-containing protein n=1 Tax=Tectimicrobiota bacterium TaxID=2528274 RepID=A0A932CN42_UNCTE|nr:cupin domain-containing protein [Candidatus Tectomicrobia bacterium]
MQSSKKRFPRMARRLVPWILAAMVPASFCQEPTWAEEKKFTLNPLRQAALGPLPANKYTLKATELVMEPGAEIPQHQHKGPGIRYVLEGAITISWKEGKTETFEAGSTYFEGPGENHPAGTFSARNAGTGHCRVLIVELLPTP